MKKYPTTKVRRIYSKGSHNEEGELKSEHLMDMKLSGSRNISSNTVSNGWCDTKIKTRKKMAE